MLPLRILPTFGLHLLLLLHASESFVLLTANIEDVKKLATKFVSESLADKIATFLTKAAQNVMTQNSEEVQRDVSEENKNYNTKIDFSNEFKTYEKRSKIVHNKIDKSKKEDYYEQDDDRNFVDMENQRSSETFKNDINVNTFYQPRKTNSIEDGMNNQLNKTFNAVFDLKLRSDPEKEMDEVTEKKFLHHSHKYKLLATSGNMLLTKVISSTEVDENRRSNIEKKTTTVNTVK